MDSTPQYGEMHKYRGSWTVWAGEPSADFPIVYSLWGKWPLKKPVGKLALKYLNWFSFSSVHTFSLSLFLS